MGPTLQDAVEHLGSRGLGERGKFAQRDLRVLRIAVGVLANENYLLEAQLPILLKRDAQLETFEALAFLAQNHPNENSRTRYRDMAKDYVDSRLKTDELKEVAEQDSAGEFRVEAMFQYAMSLVSANKLDQAKEYFNRIISLAPTSYLGQQSSNMVKQLETRAYVEPKSIGVILPMRMSAL